MSIGEKLAQIVEFIRQYDLNFPNLHLFYLLLVFPVPA